MLLKKAYVSVISLLIIMSANIIIFNTLIYGNSTANSEIADNSPEKLTVFNLYYFEKQDFNKTWFVPYKPGDSPDNFTTMTTGDYMNISQGFIDRKYDPDIKPEIFLYIDNHGIQGLELQFEMEFRYFRGNSLPTEPDVIASFGSYTTTGKTDGPEEVKRLSSSYTGTPRDVPQTDYGGFFTVVISVSGGSAGDQIDIYCGREGYNSYVKTPYAEPYSAVDNKQDEPTGDIGYLLYLILAIIAVVLIILIIISEKKKKNVK